MKTRSLLLFVVTSCATIAVASDKPRNIAATLAALEAIEHLAQLELTRPKPTPEPEFKTRIRGEVRTVCNSLDAQELALLAVACSAIYNEGDVDDIAYDAPFYAAFWFAVSKLAAEKNDANYQALLFVKQRSHLGGGERLAFDDLLATFPKEVNRPK